MPEKLAIFGGRPVRERPFPPRATIGAAEKAAAMRVLDSGVLSEFYGSPTERFLGGTEVRAFEAAWARQFGYRHAISMNSWTSGLLACVGACGLGPGDEMICSPYTMSASAAVALFYGAVPVFVDVDPDTYCLDLKAVAAAITSRTKAIMAVHLFGRPVDIDALAALAKPRGIRIIEDAAQAPGAKLRGRAVGALADIGGFSLNYHKHIHTGEGGVVVTDDDDLAQRCRMIRNHGENVVEAWGVSNIANTVGLNLRLTELQAAIGTAQLDRLETIVTQRQALAARLRDRLSSLACLRLDSDLQDGTHAYYVFALRYLRGDSGVSRDAFMAAVNAELPPAHDTDSIPFWAGYVRPLYLAPLYQRQIAIGDQGFPFNAVPNVKHRYDRGSCPVVERLHETELLVSCLVRDPLTLHDIDDFADAIEKVAGNLAALAQGS